MSKNRKKINKSPIVVTRETDLTGTSNSAIRANGKGGGRFDGSIFIPTTPTGDGPTPTPIPTTTTSTTDNGETTTTTTDNGETTTTTTDNGETTTTSTIDYTVLPYQIITSRNVQSFPGSQLPVNYVFGLKDSNGDFVYSDYDVKCIVETIPTGGYGSWTIGVENNSDEYLSVGDNDLVRFNFAGTEVVGPFNQSTRGYYIDTETRFSNTIDKYIINIVSGEVVSIVSFDSIGDVSGCNLPTETTTTTTTILPQLNEVEGSNRFELNNSEIQTEYQNITDLAYSFQEAKDQDVDINQEIFDLVTYSHNQENEWDGYVDGDVVPMSVTNDTQKVYYYDELEIGSQLYDDSHNEITGSDMLYIHTDIINSNFNVELLEVQQNGGTLSFVGYEDGIVTELFTVFIDFTGRVYPIATLIRSGQTYTCFPMANSDNDGFHFSDEEVKNLWGDRTFPSLTDGGAPSSSYVQRIAVSDITEGSLSIGDESLVRGFASTDIDNFTTFDDDLKGVYYDVYKRFGEVAELYVITIVNGTVTGIVNFNDINDINNTPDNGVSTIRRIYENGVTLPNGDTFNFGYGGNGSGSGINVNTGQELKCAVINLGINETSRLQTGGYRYRTESGLTVGTKLYTDLCLNSQSDWDGIYVFYKDSYYDYDEVDGVTTSHGEEFYIFEISDGVITTEPIVISEEYFNGLSFTGTINYESKFIDDGSDGFNVCGEYDFPNIYQFESDTNIGGEIYTWTDRSLGSGEYIYSNEDIKCLYETGGVVNSELDNPNICKLENTPLSVGDDELRQTIANGTDSMNFNDNIRGIYTDTDNTFGQNYVSPFGNIYIRKYIIDIVQGEVISITRLDLLDDVESCPPTTTTTTTMSGTNSFIRLINWEFNNQLYIYELMGNQTVDSDFESIYCNEDVNFGDISFDGKYSTTDTNSQYPHLGDVIYENEYSQTPLNEGVWLSYPWNDVDQNFDLDKLAWYITDSNGILITIDEITCPTTTTTTTEDVTTTTTTVAPTTTTTTTDDGLYEYFMSEPVLTEAELCNQTFNLQVKHSQHANNWVGDFIKNMDGSTYYLPASGNYFVVVVRADLLPSLYNQPVSSANSTSVSPGLYINMVRIANYQTYGAKGINAYGWYGSNCPSPTTTTTTVAPTTTTTTINYEGIVYQFYNSITPANSNTTYDFSDMTSPLEVKCAWDHFNNNPNGVGGSASYNNTQESIDDGDYISIGDIMVGSGYTNPINNGYYSYDDANAYLGNPDTWAIKIENGAIVSMDSFSSLPSCDDDGTQN